MIMGLGGDRVSEYTEPDNAEHIGGPRLDPAKKEIWGWLNGGDQMPPPSGCSEPQEALVTIMVGKEER